MGRRIRAIARKEALHIARDPRALAVVLVLPVLLLVIYGYAVNFDIKHLPLGVADFDRSRVSRELVEAFTRTEYFDLVATTTRLAEVREWLDRGQVRLALVIPEGFAAQVVTGRSATVQFLVDGADANTASIALGYAELLLRWQAEQLVQRALQRWGTTGRTQGCIIVEPRVLYNPELRSTNFIVPGLIAIFLAMLTTLLTALTIIREREQGTLERLIVSPLRPWELMVGKMIPYAFISLVNVFLVIIAGLQVFHVPFRGSLGLLLGLSGIFILGVLGLGLLFSILAPRGEVAVVLVVLTTVLPSLLLSGFVFPLPSMPKVLQGISLAVPARHFLVIVRGIFLKDLHLEVLWPQTLTLLIFAGLMLLLSARRFRKRL